VPCRRPGQYTALHRKVSSAISLSISDCLDAEGWARLVTGKGSREKALSQVSVREPAIITNTRRQAIEAGSERAWEAKQEEDLFLLANFLVSQFKARLMSDELILQGYLNDLL
jgi:hypothetical protein